MGRDPLPLPKHRKRIAYGGKESEVRGSYWRLKQGKERRIREA